MSLNDEDLESGLTEQAEAFIQKRNASISARRNDKESENNKDNSYFEARGDRKCVNHWGKNFCKVSGRNGRGLSTGHETQPCPTRRVCLYSFMISLGVCALISYPEYLIIKKLATPEQVTVISEPLQPFLDQPIAHALTSSNHMSVAQFTVDRDKLHKENVLSWIQTQPSGIANAISTLPCVEVNETGLYGIFSQISFRFEKKSKEHTGGHGIMRIINGPSNGNETLTKRVIFVPTERDEAIIEPSNLAAFPQLNAFDKICVMVDPVSHIYKSILDNQLTLVKLY